MKVIKVIFWSSLLVLFDQLIKGWARTGPSFVINRQYLIGQYIFDPIVVTCIILVFVLLLVWFEKNLLSQNQLSLTLLIAGSVSNLIDRLYWGGVIDFVSLKIANFDLLFNLADIFISTGIILYVTRKTQKNFD